MRYYDNHAPNSFTRAVRKQPPVALGDHPSARLLNIAKGKAESYNLASLILDTPDVVRWLRGRMRSGLDANDGGGKSRAPYKMSFMAAADREAEALAYWCEQLCAPIGSSDGLYVRNGMCYGVVGNESIAAVENLSNRLCMSLTLLHRLLDTTSIPDAVSLIVATDPRYGVWTVRRQNYAQWPELAAHFIGAPEPEMHGNPSMAEDSLF